MSFQKTELSNGLKIVTETVPSVRSVSIGFWIGIGSRDEKENISGISHFLEHMLFKGTEKRTARDIVSSFEALGGDVNAQTSREYTVYYARILDQHLPQALEILSDILKNSLLEEKELNLEREVVLEEIKRLEDSPDEVAYELFARTIWENHPLGRSILGRLDTIKSIAKSDISNYWRNNYIPSNMVVALAGNIKHDDALEAIKQYFDFDKGKIEKRRIRATLTGQKKAVVVKETEQVHICLGTESFHQNHEDRFGLAIFDSILGGGMSSRLFQEIREKRGLVYSIYSTHSLYSDTGNMLVYAGTRPENAKEVLSLIQEEINKIVADGVTPQEMERMREHLKGGLVLSLESTAARMNRIGRMEVCQGEILSIDQLIERLDSVTLDDINRIARELFKDTKTVLALVGPIKEDEL